ncbi:GIY-YIG nuclease family protein [candidate division KSB1 bacterium]
MSTKTCYIYIITNSYNTTFYIGVTNDLSRRMFEHKNELIKGFSKKYKLKKLVYFEDFNNIKDAISREKQLKHWHREWKLNLVKSINPTFKDLSEDLGNGDPETSSG